MKKMMVFLLVTLIGLTGCSSNLAVPAGVNAEREAYDPENDKFGDRITLTWEVPDNDSTLKYRIYRAWAVNAEGDLSDYTMIASTQQQSYTDDLITAGVQPGIIYYKISSVNNEGKESALSQAVSIEYMPYG